MTTRGIIMWVLMLAFSAAWLIIGNSTAAAIWTAASLLVIHMEYLHGRR